jgi:hypothetical protein
MTITIKEENKGTHQETSLEQFAPSIHRQMENLLSEAGITTYEPQSFVHLPEMFNIYNHLRKNLTEQAMSKLEGLAALFGALSSTTTSTGFISILTLYAKTHYSQSLVSQLTTVASSLFEEMTPQSSERPRWLADMSLAMTNWKLLTSSPSFAKISRVLSLLVTLGVTDKISLSLGNFEIFAVEAMQKQASAFDLIDALIETVTYFAEGAYMCFLTGSMKPLLFSSNDIVQLEEKFIQLTTEWEFVRNGNLSKFTDKDESEFDKDLSDTIEKLSMLYKTMPNGTEKKIVQQKWENLSKIRADFISTRVSGGLRKSPYTIKIFGNSGVGKSTFADISMAAVLKAMNVPSSPEYIVTLDEKEKYMSTYRSYVTGIKLDDYGNAKSDFWETAPSDWIIRICNNIRQAAIMADLANKGKITIEPRCLTITTNVEHLHAGVTSYNPISILRRAHTHVELEVRPEFMTDNMLDSQKVIDRFGTLEEINDIWLVTLKQPVGDGPGKQHFSSWKVTHKQIDIFEYLNYIISEARKHDSQQSTIVDSFNDPSNLVQICSTCNCLSQSCTCDIEPQFGERLATVISSKVAESSLSIRKLKLKTETKVEDLAVDTLLKGFTLFSESPFSVWTSYVPEQWMDNEYVKAGILYAGQDWIGQSVQRYIANYCLFTLLLMFLCSYVSYYLCSTVLFTCVVYFFICFAGVVEAKKNAYLNEIHNRRGVLPAIFKSARDKHVKYACGLFASLAVVYAAVKVIKALRSSLSIQGSLNPTSVSELQTRDAENKPWQPVAKVAASSSAYTANSSQMNARLEKSSGQIFIDNKFSGAFAVSTNVLIVPSHFLPKETVTAKFVLGSRPIKFVLNPDLAYILPNSDLALLYVPNTGPLKNMTDFFMEENITQPTVANVNGIRADGTTFSSRILWQFCSGVSNGPYVFNGAYYNLTKMLSFPGMCMAPIISETSRAGILGFHIGGVSGTSKGCGISVLSSDITLGMQALFNLSKTHIEAPQAADITDVVCGKKIAISPTVHPKCPSQFIDKDTSIQVYGSVSGRNTFKSAVISTPISQIVSEVCGVDNQWGPPKFDNPIIRSDGHVDQQRWKPWYTSLDVCSNPSIGFDPVKVEAAMDDYLAGLQDVFNLQSTLWKQDMRPLSDIEIVSGIDGKHFVDSMNNSTSMGYPIHGPKSNFLVDLEPTDNQACPRTFTPEIWDLRDELVARAGDKEFLNCIFGSSLKDEPTKLSKEKVRVFQAAPIALQILIRKYFLPIARFLSMNPLVAECAVGINSHGSDWHELSQFMAKFGDEQIIAGDYAKYDLRMPAQLTLSAFSVMIEIAKWSGNYSSSDVKIMEVIAHDICSPLVAFNGTLIRFMGTNPSGQNMTVYINSIVNSLLHRLAFHDAYPVTEMSAIGEQLKLGRPAVCRDIFSLMTYGDDAKGSVRAGFSKFNHVQMANFFAANDIVFTMPDKESEPIPYMTRTSADFLKRSDRFDEDLDAWVGALDENSIFKSLHSILESKVVSPITVSAMNIDGALREWFFHGPEVFNKRLSQMKIVAERANLPVPGLNVTYEDRVADWKEKYAPQSGEIEEQPTPILSSADLDEWFELLDDLPENMLVKINATLKKDISERSRQKLTLKRDYLVDFLVDFVSVESDSLGYSFSIGDISEISAITEPLIIPEPVADENTLIEDTIAILGNPTGKNFQLGLCSLGEMDLLYIRDGVALVIECKRVVGRTSKFRHEVVDQAIKYSTVVSILRPDLTVYGITCTEYGYTIVESFGEPLFPAFCAEFLDNIPVAM